MVGSSVTRAWRTTKETECTKGRDGLLRCSDAGIKSVHGGKGRDAHGFGRLTESAFQDREGSAERPWPPCGPPRLTLATLDKAVVPGTVEAIRGKSNFLSFRALAKARAEALTRNALGGVAAGGGGSPFGERSSQERTAKQLGPQSALRPRGRPWPKGQK